MNLAFRNAMCRSAPATERALLLGMLDRADVTGQLQAAGIAPQAARERVRAIRK